MRLNIKISYIKDIEIIEDIEIMTKNTIFLYTKVSCATSDQIACEQQQQFCGL